jgi:hypothetical protein
VPERHSIYQRPGSKTTTDRPSETFSIIFTGKARTGAELTLYFQRGWTSHVGLEGRLARAPHQQLDCGIKLEQANELAQPQLHWGLSVFCIAMLENENLRVGAATFAGGYVQRLLIIE